jgi:hypothetical protein
VWKTLDACLRRHDENKGDASLFRDLRKVKSEVSLLTLIHQFGVCVKWLA